LVKTRYRLVLQDMFGLQVDWGAARTSVGKDKKERTAISQKPTTPADQGWVLDRWEMVRNCPIMVGSLGSRIRRKPLLLSWKKRHSPVNIPHPRGYDKRGQEGCRSFFMDISL